MVTESGYFDKYSTLFFPYVEKEFAVKSKWSSYHYTHDLDFVWYKTENIQYSLLHFSGIVGTSFQQVVNTGLDDLVFGLGRDSEHSHIFHCLRQLCYSLPLN